MDTFFCGPVLSEKALQAIEDESLLTISPMVLLELDYLHELGRVTLAAAPVYDYLHERMDLRICDKSFVEVIRHASRQTWTRDPFDRIIAAHAAIGENGLITKDQTIRDHYAHAVW